MNDGKEDINKRWFTNESPQHRSFPAHGSSVVTCLIFSHGSIITASDDRSIHIHSPVTGELQRVLDGHEGGVWAIVAYNDILVSGSTDTTVRVWDLNTGKCTHVFSGHTATVRALTIVKPELVEVDNDGVITKETWPKRPLIVSGSRDHTIRVWTLPQAGEPEYRPDAGHEDDAEENPYHRDYLHGHDHAVRALDARGRTLVSGSYDKTVRVWDIITGTCKWVLVGHTDKVFTVVLDLDRQQAYSGSMDHTVRIWNIQNGQCKLTLTDHTSVVGLLALSPSYLVSAAADATTCVWDPDTGTLKHTLPMQGAITCFQHDESKVVSGSDGILRMWNIKDGTLFRDLLTGVTGVWQVAFEERWCIAASNRENTTMIDVWDFGEDGEDAGFGESMGADDESRGEKGNVEEDEVATERIRRFADTHPTTQS